MFILTNINQPHQFLAKTNIIKMLCFIICLGLFTLYFVSDSKATEKNMKKITFVSDKSWTAYDDNPLESNQSLGYAQLVKLQTNSPPWASPQALVYGHWAGGWPADLSLIPNAHWIWAPGVTGQTPTSVLHTVFFTKTFDLIDYPLEAEIYIAADDFAQVIVNNQNVGIIGSIADVTKAGQAQSSLTKFDISQFLLKGTNTITIRAQNGFVQTWGGSYSRNPAGVVFGGSISFAKNVPTTDKEYVTDMSSKSDNQSGLVAYYPFNGSANDMSGNNSDGILYGVIPSKDRQGKDKSAYYFNGQDSYIVVPNSTTLNSINKAISLAAWIKIDPTTNYDGYTHHHIISKGATYGNLWADFALGISKVRQIDFEETNKTNSPERFNSEQTLQHDRWYHLVATFEENTIKLYLDGKLLKVDQSPHSVFRNSSQPFYIGCRYRNPLVGVFKGSIDDIRIYNRVLSDKEVLKLYSSEE